MSNCSYWTEYVAQTAHSCPGYSAASPTLEAIGGGIALFLIIFFYAAVTGYGGAFVRLIVSIAIAAFELAKMALFVVAIYAGGQGIFWVIHHARDALN